MPRQFTHVLLTFCLVSVLSAEARAEGFSARFRASQEAIAQGDTATALEELRELQVDHPDDLLVQYAMGRALYEQGQRLLEAPVSGEDAAMSMGAAEETFTQARAAFEKVYGSTQSALAPDAAFAKANTYAVIARQYDVETDYQGAVKAYESAVREMTSVTQQFPQHQAALDNLNHLRYSLKKLLQSPPPDQEKQDDQKQEDNDENSDQPKPQINFARTEIPGASVDPAQAEAYNRVRLIVPGKTAP